jgi:hypothetical protein
MLSQARIILAHSRALALDVLNRGPGHTEQW